MTRIGICGTEVGDEVEPPGAHQWVEAVAHSSRTLGSRSFIFLGVNTRERSDRCRL